jgi:hypothetical protein
VFVPVRGLTVETPVRVGRITIVPKPQGQAPLSALDLTADHIQALVAEYRDATAYATISIDADSLDTAEELGYTKIETAIAWLVARQRYGLLRLPDGTPQTFSRIQALQNIRYAAVVLVQGKTTGRQWLRWVNDVGSPMVRDLTPGSDLLRPEVPLDLDPRDERALRALMRAVNEPSAQQQVQALAEALENYAAGVKVPGPFSTEQVNELKKLAPDWLTDTQRKKFGEAVAGLNGSPFQRRLSERLERDGVPLTVDERELLFDTLRRTRNDVAHGRAVKNPPTREEILRGISVVSRALMFSIAQSQAGGVPDVDSPS